MKEINSANMLAQIRQLNAQLEGRPIETGDNKVDFSATLNDSIKAVNELQSDANAQATAFESGAPDADLTQVMISLQKASLSFQAMTEVRNKLVNAYQEVMNMPV